MPVDIGPPSGGRGMLRPGGGAPRVAQPCERAHAGDAAMRRCGDAAMRRCGDAAMRRCGDAAMRRCGDAAMRRCGDAAMRRCGDAAMRRLYLGPPQALSSAFSGYASCAQQWPQGLSSVPGSTCKAPAPAGCRLPGCTDNVPNSDGESTCEFYPAATPVIYPFTGFRPCESLAGNTWGGDRVGRGSE